MRIPQIWVPVLFAALATAGLLTGCGTTTHKPAGTPAAAVGSATVAPGHPAVGDVPEAQAYVPYRPPSQLFTVSVPKGWAQTDDGSATVFTDDVDTMRIEIVPFLGTLTPDVVRREELPPIQSASPGYHFGAVAVVQRKGGPVILATYQVNSAPNGVTGKGGVEAVERYSFWRDDHEVILTLSGPVGTDNLDRWRTITDSLQWQ